MITTLTSGVWKQLQAGPVTVNQQETLKAADLKDLFSLGLIRYTRGKTTESFDVVLSESGIFYSKIQDNLDDTSKMVLRLVASGVLNSEIGWIEQGNLIGFTTLADTVKDLEVSGYLKQETRDGCHVYFLTF